MTPRQLYGLVGDHFDPGVRLAATGPHIAAWLSGQDVPLPGDPAMDTYARLRCVVIEAGYPAQDQCGPRDVLAALIGMCRTANAAHGGRDQHQAMSVDNAPRAALGCPLLGGPLPSAGELPVTMTLAVFAQPVQMELPALFEQRCVFCHHHQRGSQ